MAIPAGGSQKHTRWAIGGEGHFKVNRLLFEDGDLSVVDLTTTRVELADTSTRYVLERPGEPPFDADELHRGAAIGRVLSRRYRLERFIGHGRFSAVYEASVIDGGHPWPRGAIKLWTRPSAHALASLRAASKAPPRRHDRTAS